LFTRSELLVLRHDQMVVHLALRRCGLGRRSLPSSPASQACRATTEPHVRLTTVPVIALA
jgi:hypothetical protein